ncbi:MAG: GPR endopeptidase [Ruminiclostridium sp.]|nr:GPR endopeptidase [Ruminiclostridium sp.]
MKRTDLIYESALLRDTTLQGAVSEKILFGTRYTDITVDNCISAKHGLRKGRYLTVFTGEGDVKRCLTALLGELFLPGDALVVGLGNGNICSDSLGVKALAHIPATAHLSANNDFTELGMRRVYVLEAGVTGKTGLESSSRVSCIVRHVHANFVVAIDSLACSGIERLCTTIQITDTGIAPGSGVGNDRKALDLETVGVPVIAVGVPTVTDLDSIVGDVNGHGLMVTPRSIDVSVAALSRTIGEAVSGALNPSLSGEELRELILL